MGAGVMGDREIQVMHDASCFASQYQACSGVSTSISQASGSSSRDHATAAALRDSAHRVRSTSFPMVCP
jgi:hypothetical protein